MSEGVGVAILLAVVFFPGVVAVLLRKMSPRGRDRRESHHKDTKDTKRTPEGKSNSMNTDGETGRQG